MTLAILTRSLLFQFSLFGVSSVGRFTTLSSCSAMFYICNKIIDSAASAEEFHRNAHDMNEPRQTAAYNNRKFFAFPRRRAFLATFCNLFTHRCDCVPMHLQLTFIHCHSSMCRIFSHLMAVTLNINS